MNRGILFSQVYSFQRESSSMSEDEHYVTKAEAEQMIEEAVLRQRLLFEKEKKERLLMHRKMEMQETLREFNGRPADRRAVRFIKDILYDLEDLKEQMAKVQVQVEGSTDEDAKVEAIKSFYGFCMSWYRMESRKFAAELEAYKVANRAIGGWETEKIYNESKADYFSFSSKEREWWKKDDDTPAEKEKRFRAAEREFLSRQENMDTCDDDVIFSEDE